MLQQQIKFERVWAMPNHKTFDILPIKNLLKEEMTTGLWADPFARDSKLAQLTNDINPKTSADSHLDALDFLKTIKTESLDGLLFDPPYSVTQVKQCYDGLGIPLNDHSTKPNFWTDLKIEIARIVKPSGKVISFGWNSGGIGKTLGFEITRILLVPHGGIHNDTIVTCEKKVQASLTSSPQGVKQ